MFLQLEGIDRNTVTKLQLTEHCKKMPPPFLTPSTPTSPSPSSLGTYCYDLHFVLTFTLLLKMWRVIQEKVKNAVTF